MNSNKASIQKPETGALCVLFSLCDNYAELWIVNNFVLFYDEGVLNVLLDNTVF